MDGFVVLPIQSSWRSLLPSSPRRFPRPGWSGRPRAVSRNADPPGPGELGVERLVPRHQANALCRAIAVLHAVEAFPSYLRGRVLWNPSEHPQADTARHTLSRRRTVAGDGILAVGGGTCCCGGMRGVLKLICNAHTKGCGSSVYHSLHCDRGVRIGTPCPSKWLPYSPPTSPTQPTNEGASARPGGGLHVYAPCPGLGIGSSWADRPDPHIRRK